MDTTADQVYTQTDDQRSSVHFAQEFFQIFENCLTHSLYANIVKPYIGNDCSAFRLINSFMDEPQRCYLKATPSILSCRTTAGPNTRHAAHRDQLLQTFFFNRLFCDSHTLFGLFVYGSRTSSTNTRIQAFVKEDYAVCIYKSPLCTKVSGLRVVLQPHFICFLPLFLFFFQQPMR